MESVFYLSKAVTKTIEQVIQDENVHYNHMILPNGNALPVHKTNSNVYMTVVKGTLTISLERGEYRRHPAGTVLRLPFGVEMHAKNDEEEILELIVIKAPAPVNK